MSLADHLRMVEDRRAFDSARMVLETLEGLPFVVVGGWAVHAHGSTVPSVDLDIWIELADHEAIYDTFLDKHDIQLDAKGVKGKLNLDIDYLDDVNPLFGSAGQYVRNELATEWRHVLGHEVRVLTGPDLLFAKAKAFHDRSKHWRLSGDPVALAALNLKDPQTARFIRDRGEAYWLRKAGKDLVDVRFLQQRYEMGGPERLRTAVEEALASPDPSLIAWGSSP